MNSRDPKSTKCKKHKSLRNEAKPERSDVKILTVDLDVSFYVQKQILGFQISMDDQIGVTVFDATDNLSEKASCLFLSQFAARHDVSNVEEKKSGQKKWAEKIEHQ